MRDKTSFAALLFNTEEFGGDGAQRSPRCVRAVKAV